MFTGITGIYLLVVLVSLVVSLGIHEAMHGFVAHWLGDDTAKHEGRLTLNPLAHVDFFTTILLPMVLIMLQLPPILAAKPVPFNPDRLKHDEFGAALVGLAGPLTNLVLAGLGAVAFRLFTTGADSFIDNSLVLFVALNVGICLFNMIPFPPLDGSRVLYAFAPEPLQALMRQIEAMGFFLLLGVIIIAFPLIAGPLGNIENGILNFLLG